MTRGRWRADFVHVRANDAIWGPQAADFVQVDDNDEVQAARCGPARSVISTSSITRGRLLTRGAGAVISTSSITRGRSITRGPLDHPGGLDHPGEARCFRVATMTRFRLS